MARPLHGMVRVLVRLPGGEDLCRRSGRVHARAAQGRQEGFGDAPEQGPAIRLSAPGARCGGPDAEAQQPFREHQQAAQGPHAQPPGNAAGPQDKGGLLVVLHAHGASPAPGSDTRADADGRRYRRPEGGLRAEGEGSGAGRMGCRSHLERVSIIRRRTHIRWTSQTLFCPIPRKAPPAAAGGAFAFPERPGMVRRSGPYRAS